MITLFVLLFALGMLIGAILVTSLYNNRQRILSRNIIKPPNKHIDLGLIPSERGEIKGIEENKSLLGDKTNAVNKWSVMPASLITKYN